MPTTIQAVSTQVFANRCGDNLLNKNLTFDAPFSANIVSGTGTANTSTDISYAGARSLYINNLSATDPLIISGGGTNWHNDFTGSYVLGTGTVFQFSVFNSMGSGTTATGRFRVFVGGFELYTIEFTTISFSCWETFFVTLPFYDNYDFTFEFDSPDPAGGEIYLDGLKLEIDDKQSNIPSPYTSYVPKIFEATQTIDVPNIVDGTTATVTATLTGAVVGDFVQMVEPIALINAGLEVGRPVATADDEIKFTIRNNTGGDVNPASADYIFKIVR